jgi:acetyltransferase-like isoleucine patch superfamily enzyme
VRGLIFIDKDVRIRSADSMAFGCSVMLNDQGKTDARSRSGIKLRDNVAIGEYCSIECISALRFPCEDPVIGDNVGFSQCSFIGVRGPVTIGNHVMKGQRVTIYAENHYFADPATPISI